MLWDFLSFKQGFYGAGPSSCSAPSLGMRTGQDPAWQRMDLVVLCSFNKATEVYKIIKSWDKLMESLRLGKSNSKFRNDWQLRDRFVEKVPARHNFPLPLNPLCSDSILQLSPLSQAKVGQPKSHFFLPLLYRRDSCHFSSCL